MCHGLPACLCCATTQDLVLPSLAMDVLERAAVSSHFFWIVFHSQGQVLLLVVLEYIQGDTAGAVVVLRFVQAKSVPMGFPGPPEPPIL